MQRWRTKDNAFQVQKKTQKNKKNVLSLVHWRTSSGGRDLDNTILKIEHISKFYPGVTALNDVSFTIQMEPGFPVWMPCRRRSMACLPTISM